MEAPRPSLMKSLLSLCKLVVCCSLLVLVMMKPHPNYSIGVRKERSRQRMCSSFKLQFEIRTLSIWLASHDAPNLLNKHAQKFFSESLYGVEKKATRTKG